MKPLIEILEILRKKKKILKNQLCKALGLSLSELNRYIAKEKMPAELIDKWAEFLEIQKHPSEGYLALHQYNYRERVFRFIPGASELARKTCADILYFNDKIDIQALRNYVYPQIINQIYQLPREVDNVIGELRLREQQSGTHT